MLWMGKEALIIAGGHEAEEMEEEVGKWNFGVGKSMSEKGWYGWGMFL